MINWRMAFVDFINYPPKYLIDDVIVLICLLYIFFACDMKVNVDII